MPDATCIVGSGQEKSAVSAALNHFRCFVATYSALVVNEIAHLHSPFPVPRQVPLLCLQKLLKLCPFPLEGSMAKPSLSSMDVQSLMDLRKRVEGALVEHRAVLEKQLALLGGDKVARRGRRKSTLKGRKVPPKYRDRSGNTWAGRGAKPRWLVAAIKEGRKIEDFLIDSSARKKRRSKR